MATLRGVGPAEPFHRKPPMRRPRFGVSRAASSIQAGVRRVGHAFLMRGDTRGASTPRRIQLDASRAVRMWRARSPSAQASAWSGDSYASARRTRHVLHGARPARRHGFDSLARKAATPVSAGQLVGDSCATSRTNCCLNIADEFGTWKANGPVKPTLGAVCGEPCLEFCEPGAQPI